MSETMRVYSGFGTQKRRHKSGFLKFLFKLVFLIVLLLFIGFVWTTRDLYPVERFIPTAPAFQVFSPQLMQNYPTLIESPLWELAEPSSMVLEVKKLLSDQQTVPLWVIKHLIYDFFYFSVNNLKTFEDALLIVRLSRIGCVIENLYSLTQPIEIDWAGGLNLRYLPKQKLYYARKGRVLILSPNRETLVQSITQKGDKKTETVLAAELMKNQEKHLAWGTFTPQQQDFQGLFSQIHFYLALMQNQLGLKCETQITPDMETPWTILLAEVVSSPLQEPVDTLFSCSINTGVPLKTWVRAFETIPKASINLPSANPTEIPFIEWIKSFSPFVNNEFHIALDTFYTDEIIPFIPKYCVIAKTNPNICENIVQTIMDPTIIIMGEKNKALPASNSNEYIIPLIGSSQTDLHIQCAEGSLLFANNKDLQNQVIEHIKNKPASNEGNYSLILQMKPEKLISEINNAITVLTESNILQFNDPKKINDLFNKIKLFKEIKIKISLNKGQLKIAGIAEFNSKTIKTAQ
ncbi:MAG TPA: hypothetical protein PLA12_05160 [Candidatus Hydrogenedens sp.]|nr:hypothetical protein [Candidatus Hydrogenedens sp.]